MDHNRLLAAAAALGLALSLSACSEESTTDANATYCEKQAAVQAEVAGLRSLVTSGDATVEQVQEQREAIAAALDDSQGAAGGLADSVRNDVQAADDTFTSAVDAIPGDASLATAAQDYASAIQAWNASVDSIRAEVGCN